jgi:gas vesicle protein
MEVFMSEHNGSGFGWFLAGLGLGAAVGMLYAPKAGRETREELLRRAEEGREFVKTRARDAREQANQLVDKGKQAVEQQKDQFRSAYEAGRQAYKEATAKEAGKTST